MVLEAKNEVCLTFDTDWLCDAFLETTIEILEEYDLSATFFATNESSLLKSLDQDRYEIALHPNFLDEKFEWRIDALSILKEIYPEATGTRSHCLTFSSRMLPDLKSLSIQYESNIFLFGQQYLLPVLRAKNFWSLPFFWSDDKYLELAYSFKKPEFFDLKEKGLKVYNFHPVHIFLNTDRVNRYENSRITFNTKNMFNYVNKGLGVRTIFIDLCRQIKALNLKTKRMKDVI